VIARTSAVRYKRTDKPVDQIGRELGVEYLLEGSVRRAAARVRITAQLIQVSDQTHLWAESYEGELTDVLSLQSEVARAIAREIRTAIDPEEEDRLARAQARKVSPEAFEAYLKGRYFLDKGPQGAEKSLEYCRMAIENDPTYAPAWAGLADTWAVLGFRYCTVPPRTVFPEARAAALKALELEQGLAEAHVSLANVLAAYDWDWPAAESAFRRGLELNPNSALAHSYYYGFLLRLERHEEAVAELHRAQQLDPLSLHVNYDLGWHLYRTRQYDGAIAQMKKAVELDPLSSWAHHALGEMCAEKGLFDEAVLHMRRAIELSPDIPHYVSAMGYILGRAGQPGEARRLLEKLERQARKRYIAPHEMALVHTGLGQNDEAFAWFDRAFEERDPWLTLLQIAPKLDGIRDDARFADLLRRVGFPA
jgi:tetratricopeptide (TPR) repeat protein